MEVRGVVMTDYYAIGGGRRVDGPYKLDDAREKAVELAKEDGRGQVLAVAETVQGVREDDIRKSYKEYE